MDGVRTDEYGRPEVPLEGDELATLRGFLDYQRATLDWKTRGLTDAELRVALPPTTMTLGGMLKHLACVEDYWFTRVVGEQETAEPWRSVDWDSEPDWDWTSAADDTGEELRGLWAERVERSRGVLRDVLAGGVEAGLAAGHPAWDGQAKVSTRWVLTHMIEEYARHNGHADLIRESVDGETGE